MKLNSYFDDEVNRKIRNAIKEILLRIWIQSAEPSTKSLDQEILQILVQYDPNISQTVLELVRSYL